MRPLRRQRIGMGEIVIDENGNAVEIDANGNVVNYGAANTAPMVFDGGAAFGSNAAAYYEPTPVAYESPAMNMAPAETYYEPAAPVAYEPAADMLAYEPANQTEPEPMMSYETFESAPVNFDETDDSAGTANMQAGAPLEGNTASFAQSPQNEAPPSGGPIANSTNVYQFPQYPSGGGGSYSTNGGYVPQGWSGPNAPPGSAPGPSSSAFPWWAWALLAAAGLTVVFLVVRKKRKKASS